MLEDIEADLYEERQTDQSISNLYYFSGFHLFLLVCCLKGTELFRHNPEWRRIRKLRDG
jgi:hypothetical protein